MLITGLSGKSGTGKSYHAQELAARIRADAIIDDGLLICNGAVVAGISAKKQKTKLGAVRTAIFTDEEHRFAVRSAIKEEGLKHILVLGTSDDMVRLIAKTLELPEPSRIIHIEDITTSDQREYAEKQRNDEGMHTIPVPTMQIKKQLSGLFFDSSRAFRSGVEDDSGSPKRTVVRPNYSYLGSYSISDKAIEQIIGYIAESTPGIGEVLFTTCDSTDEGLYVRIIVTREKGAKNRKAAEILQQHATSVISHMTSFNVLGIEVEIRGCE